MTQIIWIIRKGSGRGVRSHLFGCFHMTGSAEGQLCFLLYLIWVKRPVRQTHLHHQSGVITHTHTHTGRDKRSRAVYSACRICSLMHLRLK